MPRRQWGTGDHLSRGRGVSSLPAQGNRKEKEPGPTKTVFLPFNRVDPPPQGEGRNPAAPRTAGTGRLPTRLRRPAPSLSLSARPDPERRQHRLWQSGGTEGAGDFSALIVPLPPRGSSSVPSLSLCRIFIVPLPPRGGPSGPPPTPSPREYPCPHPHFPTSSFSLEVDLTH